MSAPVWRSGEASVRERVERWAAGAAAGSTTLASSSRRSLVRLDVDDGPALLVKRFLGAARPGLRANAGLREWRHLTRLGAAGVPVAPVRGLARVGDDVVLVLTHLDGQPLESLRGAPTRERRRQLAAAGRAIASMHRAGCRHRDLHTGNIWLTEAGPVLLDFQRSRRSRSEAARMSDLGALDFSLRHNGFGPGDRLALRLAALGLEGGPSSARAADRERLRRVARASQRRARTYYASRTRRSVRVGRRFEALAIGRERGLRVRDIDDSVLEDALAAHDRARGGTGGGWPGLEVFQREHRSCIAGVQVGDRRVVVKEVVKPGWMRRLADVVRGSPARRAWRAGHGLAVRGIACARPLAFVEERRLGFPVASRLVIEDLRPCPVASDASVWSREGGRALDALDRLLRALHRHHVEHGDLQALHIHLRPARSGEDRLEPVVIDLEGVRFRRRLGDRRRIRSLAELNASLPDGWVSADARRRVLMRVAGAVPFDGELEAVRSDVVRESLARRHHWAGTQCGVSP